MSDTNFTNGVTLTDADWFNDLNRLHYTIFGDPADATAARNALPLITIGTPVVTTSGTSVSLSTSIPSWAKRITLVFNGVSTNGTDGYLVQLGTSGGVISTGYTSIGAISTSAPATSTESSTAGFVMRVNSASAVTSGRMTITKSGTTDLWVADYSVLVTTSSYSAGAGLKSVGGTVDRISITTTGGTNAFDAGGITVIWE